MASLSLQNAYNMYLENYAHTIPGVHENQKKAESKDTTRLLAKLNSNSPTYVSASALASKDSALRLKKITLDLEKSIEPFHKTEDSKHLPEQAAYSLDDSIADVRYAPQYSSDSSDSFLLEVEKLAKAQINTGINLNSSSQTLPVGSYSFNIGFDHMNYEFQFDISHSDTNQSIGEKVANLIQNAHIGINADYHSNENNSGYLELKTVQTGIDEGKDVIFTIDDKSYPGTRGFVQYFGLDYVRQFPDNASFSVDGQKLQYNSNQITLTNGFILNLKNQTTAPVTIGLKTDSESIMDHVDQCISSYNKSLQDIIDFEPPSSSLHVLADKLARIPRVLSDSLSELGISVNENNHLSFDRSVFEKNLIDAESEMSTREFLNPLYDFSDQVSNVLTKAILDPITFTNSSIASYKNIAKNNFANPYASSAYAGMYFNAYR